MNSATNLMPAVVILDPAAGVLGRAIADATGGELHGPAGRVQADHGFAQATAHLAELFLAGRPIIGICAAGILIRSVAACLSDKLAEPPVIAVSADGQHVVPLLGGHRGANQLSADVAAALGGTAVVTTAGDIRLGLALDAPPPGWVLANPADAKGVMGRLIAGGTARVAGEWPFAPAAPPAEGDDVVLAATERPLEGGPTVLVYHPQRLVIGIGAARNCPTEELEQLLGDALADAELAVGAVACIATIDLKADERAILDVADRLGLPVRLFDAAALERETPRLANPSDIVFREVGCHGVAEAAALAMTGADGELVVAKQKSANATVAIARAPQPVDPMSAGRGLGHVHVIGIGPGMADWRTPEAGRLIAAADEVVGYDLYLDLVDALVPAAKRTAFPLGQETERCAYALEQAGRGRTVALISSGDAGIYAMAALVEELVADGQVSDAASRVGITVSPGISALQAAAARVGAPLGHDFCTISLSDLLTPWAAIEGRVRAAADGDFVVAFYNPVSRRRRHQLADAKTILLEQRPGDTPVVLASNLGRVDENVRVTTLAELRVDDVDMLTLVLVGASSSRTHVMQGRTRVFTPRGYAAKRPLEG
ncbi:MAG: precorrin-3B C(17)-methyltransferase [Minwuia sp.]|nr:precorrin-3B C(17)-methyltransferase [Minwuia sp.]